MKTSVHPLVYPGVLILSGAALALEVVLTRVLSLMMWHHFTYVVIGVALLGFGAAGSLLTLRRTHRGVDERPPARRLGWYSLAFAALAPLSYIAMTRVAIAPLSFLSDPINQGAALLLIYGLIALPFLLVGFGICTALSSWSERVGAIYFADLLGAGLGVTLVVRNLEALGGPGMIIAVGLAGAAAALIFALSDLLRGFSCSSLGCLVGAVLLAAVLFFEVLPQARAGRLEPPMAPDKELAAVVSKGLTAIETTRWNPLARIDVTTELLVPPLMGGAFGPGTPAWRTRAITQDGTAPTSFIQGAVEPREMAFLGTASAGCAYLALKERGVPHAQALVIGVGGGVDLMIALHHQAAHVVGAEINSSTVELLRGPYAEYTGHLATRPEIELVNAEGRHYAATAERRFDVIQLSGVDTYSALSSGAHVLSESYLYTVEAIEQFLDVLTPRGILSYSRIAFADQPRETLRLVATVAEALEARGVTEPQRHVFVLLAGTWASVLVSPRPFEDEVLAKLADFARVNGYPLLHDPRAPRDNPYDEVLRATPREREAFYEAYPFQVRPASDDQPFFFNYFKWSSLFSRPSYRDGVYDSKFPVGMACLLVGLVQTLLLAAFFILRPIWGLRAGAGGSGSRLAAFFYFAALGIGFIALEIVLMQRLVLFLGHPTWSLVIVLATLLISAGLGSFTVRPGTDPQRRLRLLLVLVPVAILGGWWLIDLISAHLLHLDFTWRAAVAVGVLALPGFVLGMAFPTGIRILDRSQPELIPWAWAVNGFMTVFGSTATVLVAMEIGFARVVWIVAPLYFLGIAALLFGYRRRGPVAARAGS